MAGGVKERVLIMLSKAPVPGSVKTRLAAELGDETAAQLQAAFIADLGARFERYRQTTPILACAPDASHLLFRVLNERGWTVWPQGEGDLGQRLQRLLERALSAGAERVVMIGSDSPTLPGALLDLAFEALASVDVAIGPVPDGGYYLIGARRAGGGLFEAISWGSHLVYAETMARVAERGASFEVLPYWYDVDEVADLRAMAATLASPGPYGLIEAPETQAVLRSIEL